MSQVLLGQVCLDIYTRSRRIVPGCGILHNAFHLQRAGHNPLLITRVGRADSRELWRFFAHNQIRVLPDLVENAGQSASIEVAVTDSGEAVISNPVDGVWGNVRLTPLETDIISRATYLHTVLVKNLHAEFLRLARAGKLAAPLVSADFLDLRDFTLEQLSQFLPYVDIAFIGWKGDPADPFLAQIEQLARTQNVMTVITMGSRGIWLFDALTTGSFQKKWYAVDPVPVQANTNGCGDAFIGWFLAEYWLSRDRERAITRGQDGGRLATGWHFALPADAYPP